MDEDYLEDLSRDYQTRPKHVSLRPNWWWMMMIIIIIIIIIIISASAEIHKRGYTASELLTVRSGKT
jgi:hypothetical protein